MKTMVDRDKKEILLEETSALSEDWTWHRMILDKCTFRWIIAYQDSISKECIESPKFSPPHTKDLEFYFSWWPAGKRRDGWASLWLCVNPGSLVNYKISFGIVFTIKKNDKEICTTSHSEKTFQIRNGIKYSMWGWNKLIEKSCIDGSEKLIIDFKIIFLDITKKFLNENFLYDSELKCCQVEKKINFSKSKLLANLYEDDDYKDINFVIENETVKAHKSVISAASSVLKAMTFSDSLPSSSEDITIPINDVPLALFKELVRFIYTFEVKDLDLISKDLLPVATKYDIEDLKTQCEISLQKQLSKSNVLEYLVFADAYNAKVLYRRVISFLKKQPVLTKSKEFQEKMKTHPILMTETFQRLYC